RFLCIGWPPACAALQLRRGSLRSLRPRTSSLACQAVTREASGGWWAVTDSNRRHPACKAGALPTELTARRHSLAPLMPVQQALGRYTRVAAAPAKRTRAGTHARARSRVRAQTIPIFVVGVLPPPAARIFDTGEPWRV